MSTLDEMRPIDDTAVDVGSFSGPDLGGSGLATLFGERRRAEAEWLASLFVKKLIHDAIDTRRRMDPEAPDPVVDWEALWAVGTGAGSDELALGRVVVAAETLAGEIVRARATPGSASSYRGRMAERLTSEADLLRAAVEALRPAPGRAAEEADAPRSPARIGAAVPTGLAASPRPDGVVDIITPLVPSGAMGTTSTPTLPSIGASPAHLVPRRSVAGEPGPHGIATRSRVRVLRRQQLATVFAWVRNAGVALILFAGWQLWGTSLAQHQAQESLRQEFTSRQHQTPPTTSVGPTLISADVQVKEPPEGSVVARLQIPAIGVDQYVVEGTAEGDLQKGPGHYVGTAMPGQAGNVAIAGHRTTYGAPFSDLNGLVPGDVIDLTTDSDMAFQYVVTQAPVAVPPSDVKILNSFGDNRLTLTTCNPRYSATQRLVVVAQLRVAPGQTVSAPPTKAPEVMSKPRHVSSGGSVGWNMSYLPGAVGVLMFIVLLGLVNRRAAARYGRWGRWIILVPIWVAATYLLFGLLSSLVPATL